MLYGAPIGNDAFVRAFLAAAVSDATAAVKRLSYLESNQHKLIMLRMSFCRKLQHIQRLVPTSDHADLLGAYDECLVDAVDDLLPPRYTSCTDQALVPRWRRGAARSPQPASP